MTDFNFTETMNEEVQPEQRIEEVREKAKTKKENKDIVEEISKEVGTAEEEARAKKLAEKRARRSEMLNSDMDSQLAKFKPYVDKEPGFVFRFFNDKPGAIIKRKAMGWELVYDEEMANVSGQSDKKSAVQIPTGYSDPAKGLVAYLMKIERELYEEDQERKRLINQEKMYSIHNIEKEERFQDKEKNYQIKIDG